MAQRPKLTQAVPKLAHIAGRFKPELRRERLLIGSSVAALFTVAALRLAEPWPIKFALDRVTVNADQQGGMDATTLFALCAGGLVVLTGLRACAQYASTIGLALAGIRVLSEVRARLYRHIQRLSLSYHSRARTGDLVTRVTSDIGRLQEVAVTAAVPMLANVVTLVGMLGVMAILDWRLALVAASIVPLFWLALFRRAGSIRVAARMQRKREGHMAAQATESISAIKVVQALSMEEQLEEMFARSNKASLKEGVKTKRLSAGLERRVDVLVAIGTGAVLWYGAVLVQRGALTPGDLVVFIFYLKNAFKPMRDVAKYTARLATAAAAGERVIAVLDTEPDIVDREDAEPAPPLRGDVRFENVSLAYDPGAPVLREVDFELPAGRQVALVGPSGGGKSTISSLLLRLYEPDEGRVLVDGRDVREYTLESLRRQISIVLQDSVLFAVSARDNIRYGRPSATDEEVEAAARLAKAHDFIARLPDGYETVLGERGATLSGGERQRLAIARAAIRQSPIVVLDEPTTGLDEQNERIVWEALQRLAHGRTTLLITHDVLRASEAELILYVDEGRIVERGTHGELMALGGRYANVHGLQAAGYRELREEVVR